ncbi:MAG TPA: ATP-binding protein, partial [Solirubrobacterales bacterium]|nr:ATP-binding protein [Solirubrobacterales bacterium]
MPEVGDRPPNGGGPNKEAVMLCSVTSFVLEGIEARSVRVDVDVHRGLPSFAIVGLPDSAVSESRERVRAALVNSGFEFPLRRTVVNLSPASLRKSGPGLDLAIAAALLGASEQVSQDELAGTAFVGELGLDGSIRSVPGALAFAEAARDDGVPIVVPAEDVAQAALAAGAEIMPLAALIELPAVLAGDSRSDLPAPLLLDRDSDQHAPDLADLRGQREVRRALEIAAAGEHSLLLIGPPGAGCSMAASRLPSILPPLSREEALEVARIASACGRFGSGVRGRPFRAPHHTISSVGLLGGGNPARLGEVTLAHRGVLYLDHLEGFSRDALEALRPTLKSGEATISRLGMLGTFPACFLLVAGAIPCPCGRCPSYPRCMYSPGSVNDHRRGLIAVSGDFDLRVAISPPNAAEISGP